MKKTSLVVLSIMLIVFCMTGCFQKVEKRGSLQIVAKIPDAAGVLPQFVNYELIISNVHIVLTNGGTTVSQTQVPTNTTVSFSFTDLAVGLWDVQISAEDVQGTVVLTGCGTAEVTTGSTGTLVVPITLGLTPGDLNLQFDLPPALGVTSGTVQLINFSNLNLNTSQPLLITGSTATASFTNLTATTWGLQLDLYSGGACVFSQGEPVDVLPGKSTTLQVSINALGDLELQIDWSNLLPGQPTGLTVAVDPTGNTLTWALNPEPNIAGYIVYRATDLNGVKQFLTSTMISGPSYLDTQVQPAETYYYWVQAFNTAGYSSSLSLPAGTGLSTYGDILFAADCEGDGMDEIYSMENGIMTLVTTGSAPCWTPGQQSIIYVNGFSRDVYLYSLDQHISTQLTSGGNIAHARWSKNGNKIAFINNDANRWIYTMNPDGTGQMSIASGMEFDISPDGFRLVYVDINTGALHVVNSDGSNNITLPVEHCSRPQWSPDGSWIVFSCVIADGSRIFKIRPDGTELIQLSTMGSTNASWSPDGTKIAYADYSIITPCLRVINADGSNDTILLDHLDGEPDLIHWSHDGSKLVFTAALGSTVRDVFIINSDGTFFANLSNTPYGEVGLTVGPNF